MTRGNINSRKDRLSYAHIHGKKVAKLISIHNNIEIRLCEMEKGEY